MDQLTNDYSNVIKSFEDFKITQEQDCILTSLLKLSQVIENLKSYYYINDKEGFWREQISYLYINKKDFIYIDYFDLEESFLRTINIKDFNHWQNLSLFLDEISAFSKFYNLNIRDFIRMNYLNEKNI